MNQANQILERLGTKLVMEQGMYMQNIPSQEVPWVKGWFTLTKANGSHPPNVGTASYLSKF